jgi:hypothetical protein
MITVTKEQNGTTLVVRMKGSIEENVNFEELIGPAPAELHVYTREVPRINSVGVKGWIRFFTAVAQKGTRLKFFECSTAIVEQLNLISNFVAGGAVESIYVPFSCTACKSELIGLYPTAKLKESQLQVPELKCSKCAGKAVFDDIPEEYFGFLMR